MEKIKFNYREFLINLYKGKIEHKKEYLKQNKCHSLDFEFIEKKAEIGIYKLVIKDLKSKEALKSEKKILKQIEKGWITI